jgi:hypothetical protein
MYLVDSAAPAINNRKWNLGRLGCNHPMGRMGMSPVRLPNLGASSTAQPWRGGMGRLGAASAAPSIVYRDPGSGWSEDSAGNVYDASGNLVSLNNVPSSPGVQNPSPVHGGASNGGITTVKATQPSDNALDYASPQAAVAAGLDPRKVYAKWSSALAQFPSPQAAISAGIPAGVVNQLWQQGHVNAVQSQRNKKGKRWLGRLGAAGTGPYCVYYGSDGVTPESTDYNSDSAECLANGGAWTGGASLVSSPGPSPASGSPTINAPITIAPAPNAAAISAAQSAQLSSILPWAAGGLFLFAALSGGGGGKRR